jgi:hypothetical protein
MDQLDIFAEDDLKPGEYVIPAGAHPTTCRSCGAAIVWTRTGTEKYIPLALDTARECQGQRVATTHFATCPHGREWRKR